MEVCIHVCVLLILGSSADKSASSYFVLEFDDLRSAICEMRDARCEIELDSQSSCPELYIFGRIN